MAGIVDEYFKLYKEYAKKYSDRIAFIYMVGTFYEMYEYDGGSDGGPDGGVGNVFELASVLNIRVTLKSTKLPHSMSNPYMIGFPVSSFDDKYKDVILRNNYTVIRYDQSSEDKTRRVLAEISSPGTVFDSPSSSSSSSNMVMALYMECMNVALRHDNVKVLCGVAYSDLSTAKLNVSELYTNSDNIYVYQEIYRIIHHVNPKEIIIHINNYKGTDVESYKEWIVKTLGLVSFPIYIVICNELPKAYLQSEYQEQFLTKIYKGNVSTMKLNLAALNITLNKGLQLDIFQELDIDKMMYGIVSMIILLQYCEEHDPTILKRINKPTVSWIDQEQRLILEYNAAEQFRLIDDTSLRKSKRKKRFTSVLSVIDFTSTNIGSRNLRALILKPYANASLIQSKYDITSYFYDNQDLVKSITEKLIQISDIERLYAKLSKGTIKPKEFCNLYHSCKILQEIVSICKSRLSGRLELSDNHILQLDSFISYISGIYNIEILSNCNLSEKDKTLNSRECPINKGILPETDIFHQALNVDRQELIKIKIHLERLIPGNQDDKIKLNSVSKKTKKGKSVADNEDEEIINMKDLGLYLTDAKMSKLRESLSSVDVNLCGRIEIHPINSKYAIRSDKINKLCFNILNCMNNMGTYLYDIYKKINSMLDTTYNFFGALIGFVSDLDVSVSSSIAAHKYKYFKPEIVGDVDAAGGPSFFEASELRHPLVERIIDTEYIPNDLSLGKSPSGMLIYGCNSLGKSVLTLSVGINIILAQMGMFTACKLKYKPYKKIITRLSGEDNVIAGHSSFFVELQELRIILNHSDEHSLVLCDELCRGTEAISGAAIIISTLEHLIDKRSTFISSTHMHDIATTPRVVNLVSSKALKISHLFGIYDATVEKMICERKLKDGSGESIYGLEIAKYAGLPSEFITQANIIRKELLGVNKEILSTKTSRYNSRIYVDRCTICGTSLKLESHHIKEQHKQDDDGYIDYTHVNSSYNIIIICEGCHDTIHKHKLQLTQKQTLGGTLLSVSVSQ